MDYLDHFSLALPEYVETPPAILHKGLHDHLGTPCLTLHFNGGRGTPIGQGTVTEGQGTPLDVRMLKGCLRVRIKFKHVDTSRRSADSAHQ